MKIAYLGPVASFTDWTTTRAFPNEERIPYVTIPDCIEAVVEGEVDYAVVPLENTLEGSVPITVDYIFHEATIHITAELISPIQQHLMIHPQHNSSDFTLNKILSHSHALAQCHKYLHGHYRGIPCEQTTSTAAAAKYVSEHPEEAIAAIGNELAAEHYGLTIIKKDIHDILSNQTRFIVVHKNEHALALTTVKEESNKTTLMITLPDDHSGALHQVLSTFAWRKLNLSKIESRPLKTELGRYFFIIDVAQKMDDILLPGAISEMEALGCTVKIIGSYSSYTIGTDLQI